MYTFSTFSWQLASSLWLPFNLSPGSCFLWCRPVISATAGIMHKLKPLVASLPEVKIIDDSSTWQSSCKAFNPSAFRDLFYYIVTTAVFSLFYYLEPFILIAVWGYAVVKIRLQRSITWRFFFFFFFFFFFLSEFCCMFSMAHPRVLSASGKFHNYIWSCPTNSLGIHWDFALIWAESQHADTGKNTRATLKCCSELHSHVACISNHNNLLA